MTKIRKAVFPVAGLGTRFLPATKASPKEMLPVVDKPLIQYAVEEAVEAGIEDLIFVTGRNKRSIPDHFDKAYELEAELEAKAKELGYASLTVLIGSKPGKRNKKGPVAPKYRDPKDKTHQWSGRGRGAGSHNGAYRRLRQSDRQ